MFKINPTLANFIIASMKKWKTTLHLNYDDGTMKSRKININSGIFQGDSLDRRNKYQTIAIPVETYSFNTINWTAEDIKNLDRRTRKPLTKDRSKM